jgi:multidrug efflux pump subunit AcrB
MDLAEYSIRHRTVSWMILVLLLLGGAMAFLDLGRLEDPPFSHRDAVIVTLYPGATAEEVELELTHPLENAIRQMPELSAIRSVSMPGVSQIKAEFDQERDFEKMDVVWDKIRRKLDDARSELPAGAMAPRVFDDYGHVFGITMMVTGDNYEFSELKQYVDGLKRELELVPGVGKVSLFGEQQEQIFVEVSLRKLAALNLDLHRVIGFLNQQNSVLDAGRATVNGEFLHLRLGGLDMEIDPVIHGRDTGQLIRLSDVATIGRGYQEIPRNLLRMNSAPAVALGIAFAKGVNVVDVGNQLTQRLQALEQFRPAGIRVQMLYNQPQEVQKSISGFQLNLVMSIAVVIVVLLLTMGWRSGLIVGATLLLTILGTFILMQLTGFQLHRMSLGALVIALGMLVDNAIVVVEGVLVGLKRGQGRREACFAMVRQTRWPLLAATLIAILAFTPFGLSDSDSGQIMKAMFWVLSYSLFLSWLLAISITPFLVDILLPDREDAAGDPYGGVAYRIYAGLLDWCLRYRKTVVLLMVLLLGASVYGMGQVKKAFFPVSSTPMFYADLWLPHGTDIRRTLEVTSAVEAWISQQPEVEFVSSSVGRGAPRFLMTYMPEQSHENFAQLQVRTHKLEELRGLMARLDRELYEQYPQALHQLRALEFGPPSKSKIEARIGGHDPAILRQLGKRVEAAIRSDPASRNVYSDWKERSKELVPVVNEPEARRLGVSNEEIALTLKVAFGGLPVGLYRDGTRKLPILMRLPKEERVDFESVDKLRLWSPTLQNYVPIQQVVTRVDLRWADTLVRRQDRKRTLTVMADSDLFSGDTAENLFQRVRPKVEAVELPPGYSLEWGGEYENQQQSLAGAFGSLPLALLGMFVLTVLLFDSFRRPVVIWLTVPLAVVGVAIGLLATNMPLTFPALLGMLALTGMILKNGIVLIDQIMANLESGADTYDAVRDSAISRVRPVSLAAVTTAVGMLPLIPDPFFASMAITFIFGLMFATVLTLIVVPVLYTLFYQVKV